MSELQQREEPALWRAITWTLRITVACQCLGNWRWLAQIEETPLLGWLHDPVDIGGWNWSEASSLAVVHTVGWLALLAGFLVVLRPCAFVLLPLTLLQAVLATAMWQIDDGFPLEVAWLSPQVAALFPYTTQAARIVAPLGLMLVDPWRGQRHERLAIPMLRWGAAIAFFAHGIEAWQHHPVFVDLMIGSSERLLGWRMSQAVAEQLLSILGVVDMVVSVACVTCRCQPVLWWMAFWGAVTASSRIAANGWDMAWHTALVRAPHAGIPLAVLLYFRWIEWRKKAELRRTPQ